MNKGFTLIELLAVIIVLSVLMLIVSISVGSTLNKSRGELSEIQIKNIEDAAKTYYLKHGMNESFEDGEEIKTCVNVSELIKKGYIEGNKVIDPEDDEEMIGSVKITYSNNKYTYEYQDNMCPLTLAQYIKDLYNPTTTSLEVDGITYSLDEANGLMNDRLGSSSVGATEGNIRYYGLNPNNYIDIGDRNSSGNVILWRIIGLFKDIDITDESGNVIGTEDLVKIIRADSIGNYSWDYTSSGYDNNWNDATLKTMLNGAYYNSETTSYYNGSTTAISVDLTSIGLSESARNKVESVKWNISSSSTSDGEYVNDYYVSERATETAIWSGKVALMYSSDYGYAADLKQCNKVPRYYNATECKETDWLLDSSGNQWVLNPDSYYSEGVHYIHSDGNMYMYYYNSLQYIIRPALYLKSDVTIVGEGATGSKTNYYVVE